VQAVFRLHMRTMMRLMAAIALAAAVAGCVAYPGPPRHWQGEQGGRHRHGQGNADHQCAPCRDRFGDWDEFRSHLHGYHGIPWVRIPSVIVRVDFGWLYRG
jgi:hypothetical protein